MATGSEYLQNTKTLYQQRVKMYIKERIFQQKIASVAIII
jgi:hypothetical protein